MPTTLTLKNIPDDLYMRLKEVAALHRRSLNSEVLFSLESLLLPAKTNAQERLAQARQLRAALAPRVFTAEDIAAFRDQGRA